MNYCTKCGAKVESTDKVCSNCGTRLIDIEEKVEVKNNADNTISLIAFIFMIISCITMGWALIPLIWLIPMTIKCYKHMKYGEPISTGFKVCVLLFCSLISGIILLCEK